IQILVKAPGQVSATPCHRGRPDVCRILQGECRTDCLLRCTQADTLWTHAIEINRDLFVCPRVFLCLPLFLFYSGNHVG
ncbi:hypothetical protein STEG23_032359, partial [Scotinomys teguina]